MTGTTNTYPVTGSGTITNTALSSVIIFNRYPAYSADETLTGTATVRGIVVPLNSADTNYYDLIYRPVGSTGDTNMLVDGNANIPITVQIGDSGTIYSGKTYSDSNFTTQIGTQTVTYAVAADPSSSVYALITTTIVSKDLTGLVTSTSNNLIRIHYDGTAKRISTTSVGGNTTLSYTFPIKPLRFMSNLVSFFYICGFISLVLAPFTGITVVSAAAFFVIGWIIDHSK